MWKGVPNYLRACYWEGAQGNLETPFTGTIVSAANDVNIVSELPAIVGMRHIDSEERSVILYDGNTYYPASGSQGQATGINAGGKVVGWHAVSGTSHAYSWVVNTTTDIHPQGWDASGANAINQYGDVAGWVENGSSGSIPAYWFNTGSFYSFATPFPSLGAESEVCGINSHGEMVVTRTDAPGAVIWQVFQSEDVSYNLSGMSLMPDVAGQIASARAINDNLWMGGSYKATSQSNAVPSLIIPYDVNNNGNPDYREIVNGTEADANGNWIIDSAEVMRVGLHGPGHPEDDLTGSITNVQVVRNRIGLKKRAGVGLGGGEDIIYIDEVFQSTPECVICQNFTDLLNQWGTGSHKPNDPKQSETIVWVRSLLEDEIPDWGDHDALPANATDRQQALEDIRDFAFRFAHCIDWLQWGNEVFGGAGGYKFRNSDLSCTITDGTTFQELPEGCKAEAADKVLEWLEAQMLAAREGSAMAGRPIRMIGPGIPSGLVRGGYNDVGSGRYVTTETINLCNRHNMYFSMHVHYQTVAQAQESIEKLTGGGSWSSPPWDAPEFKVATEWGPKANFLQQGHTGDTWWGEGDPFNVVVYQRFFFGTTDPGESWDSFVGRWEEESNFWNPLVGDPGFRFDDVLGWFDGAGFTAVCYGPSLQNKPDSDSAKPDAFNIAGLCTNKVRPALEEPYFSALRIRYQNAVANGGFVISPFALHNEACPTSVTCPGCGQ